MHVSLSENVFKDFSSGKGGGILQFCREMLRRQGRQMSMLEVARWMAAEGISRLNPSQPQALAAERNQGTKRQPTAQAGPVSAHNGNRAIEIDLRPYLRADPSGIAASGHLGGHLPLSGMWLSAAPGAQKDHFPSELSAGVPNSRGERKRLLPSSGDC